MTSIQKKNTKTSTRMTEYPKKNTKTSTRDDEYPEDEYEDEYEG